ncbi:MAG: hypothetical protein JWN21_587 [Sphingomonas bacterium]|uniref:hypothetical protein n=1 Tax=Sphingomonas bacterium TaxID=1895847 RepID=UPI0026211745|nr:hypothetical protein [Sphingomonas bacterium]MDB5695044.1 hypothetical protein [Sphingomonas bacterium]
MQAFGFLLLAAGLAALAARFSWAAALAILAAAWAGTTLPDLDLYLGIGHRSGLTHSVLPAALACWHRRGFAVAAGLALGIGLHLSADLFPNAMRGFATVKLPGAGSIGPDASYWWFAINAGVALVAGTALACLITTPRVAALVLIAAAAMGLVYLYRTDGGWWALMLFAGLGWLAARGRRLAQ